MFLKENTRRIASNKARTWFILFGFMVFIVANLSNLQLLITVESDEDIEDAISEGSLVNRKVFRKAQACLLNSPFAPKQKPYILSDPKYELPLDAEKHYQELIQLTAPLRGVNISSYAGYNGPWMEDSFIREYCCDKPLSYFGGLIPLFVQWTDLWHIHRESWHNSTEGKNLFSKLRKDVIYLAISQHAQGLFHHRKFFHPKDYWNILTLSGGGSGHAAIPLFLNQLPFNPTDEDAPYLFVFAGNLVAYPVRHSMMRILEEKSFEKPSFAYRHYSGKEWQAAMRSGKLNLAPRGYGRTSFRIVEAIQLGLIPVYIYDDHDWSPYKGSEAHVSNFGFTVNISDFGAFVQKMSRKAYRNPGFLNMPETVAKMRKVRESHYTLPGLMQQIRYFFQGDKRSSIACQRHPLTYVCCDYRLWGQNT